MQSAHDILRKMVPAEAQLDASALGLELLGVTASLFRYVPLCSRTLFDSTDSRCRATVMRPNCRNGQRRPSACWTLRHARGRSNGLRGASEVLSRERGSQTSVRRARPLSDPARTAPG